MAEITALRQQVRDMKGQHAGLMPQHQPPQPQPQHQPPQPYVLPQPQATQPQPYEYQPHQSQLAGLYAPEQPSAYGGEQQRLIRQRRREAKRMWRQTMHRHCGSRSHCSGHCGYRHDCGADHSTCGPYCGRHT
ncbi:DNA translocase FtsK-like [Osmia bicornis bicornis]|uniref:DNA translocase FtsK-like n=1 Tax=Osmia bicornis bicornis TaxID=1437191 RepID=UPI001EAEF5D4|nr:DNA translocase FtsK-like [Osmia bicornis bicornis]